jgi:hypothetical protein
VPRSAYPEVNVSAELEAEQTSETLTSRGMSTLLMSSPVALGGVGAFAEPVAKFTSKASTQPRQLYDLVPPCPYVDVAAEAGQSKGSATPTLALDLLVSCSFLAREGPDDALHSPDILLIWPSCGSTSVFIAISCTSFIIVTLM